MPSTWNDTNETYCQQIGERSSSMSFMHIRSEQYYIRQGKLFSLILNIVTFIGAMLSVLYSFFPSKFLQVSGNIIAIIVAALVKYYTSSNIQDLAVLHKKSSNDFYKIYDTIQFTLASPRASRPNANDFIDTQRQKYTSIDESSPSPPKYITDDFNKKYKSNSISKPIVAGDPVRIHISRENQNFDNEPPPVINTNKLYTKRYNNWITSKISMSRVNTNLSKTSSDSAPTLEQSLPKEWPMVKFNSSTESNVKTDDEHSDKEKV